MPLEDVSHRSLLSLIVKFQRYYIFNALETFKALDSKYFKWIDVNHGHQDILTSSFIPTNVNSKLGGWF